MIVSALVCISLSCLLSSCSYFSIISRNQKGYFGCFACISSFKFLLLDVRPKIFEDYDLVNWLLLHINLQASVLDSGDRE